jgi:hypothetical protein
MVYANPSNKPTRRQQQAAWRHSLEDDTAVRMSNPLLLIFSVYDIKIPHLKEAHGLILTLSVYCRTVLMLTLFSQVVREVHVPFLTYKYRHGFKIVWFQFFKLFPVSILSQDYDFKLQSN